jgi:hypothetical protein
VSCYLVWRDEDLRKPRPFSKPRRGRWQLCHRAVVGLFIRCRGVIMFWKVVMVWLTALARAARTRWSRPRTPDNFLHQHSCLLAQKQHDHTVLRVGAAVLSARTATPVAPLHHHRYRHRQLRLLQIVVGPSFIIKCSVERLITLRSGGRSTTQFFSETTTWP